MLRPKSDAIISLHIALSLSSTNFFFLFLLCVFCCDGSCDGIFSFKAQFICCISSVFTLVLIQFACFILCLFFVYCVELRFVSFTALWSAQTVSRDFDTQQVTFVLRFFLKQIISSLSDECRPLCTRVLYVLSE